jgi:two-component system, LuxR family, response regulator FixJ
MIAEQEPTVFIVDDDPEWCYSLKWLLESINIKSETYNEGLSYLNAYNAQQRGCLLLDIRMPGISGLQLQEQLNECGCQLPIIIISGHADVPLAVRAMKAGAFDFITKPVNEQQLLDLVYKAIEHDKYRDTILNQAEIAQRYDSLTSREREIMDHVLEGKLNKQIAADLGISIKTIESHRSNLMHKLQVRNLAELFKIHHILKSGRGI